MERHVGTRVQKPGQLLGPARAEIGCDECFDLLDEFVELELAGADADARIPGLRAHLEGCSACREEHDSLVALVEETQRA
jgi:predicted anti-sigma-YlaC factor YlaD